MPPGFIAMRVKAHVYSHATLEDEHVFDLRQMVELISSKPDQARVYLHQGAAGGLIAEFSVDDAPQGALLDDISRALSNVVPDVYDVALALRD